MQPALRAEKPQKGRYREFTQCDADIFGVKSPLADAEVIALSLDIYRRLGFKQAKVLINDRTLLKDLPYPAVTAIDKLKKIGPDGVISEMVKKGIAADRAKTYLNQVKNLKPNHAIKVILDYLKLQNFDSGWYEFDPTIARSFSYSSGPIWEVVIPGFSGGSVLGGERFDQLVKKISGIDIPGTGFGLGFDRTLEAADEQDLIPKMKTVSRVLVAVFNPDFLEAAGKTAAAIRDKNLNVELFPDPEVKLDKQLKYANKKGIPFVLLIGPDEAAKNMVTLKDMKSGEQKTLTLDQAIDVLAR